VHYWYQHNYRQKIRNIFLHKVHFHPIQCKYLLARIRADVYSIRERRK
jgi:hypothetical protein